MRLEISVKSFFAQHDLPTLYKLQISPTQSDPHGDIPDMAIAILSKVAKSLQKGRNPLTFV
ncbi:hypothetical protein ABE504_18590 [Paenibacillus oryzisoli]|uniref:hypothetical protein n=1 Tax=Paenibacillus oryzisoli TaxID=1850517 RepID=UPI003D28118F